MRVARGVLNSPYSHETILKAWQHKARQPVGREGWAGLQFFVTTKPSLGFCIEQRGPGGDPWFKARLHLPFDADNRQQRRDQFARARLLYEGEYLLGDYPGKTSVWQRGDKYTVPSLYEILLRDDGVAASDSTKQAVSNIQQGRVCTNRHSIHRGDYPERCKCWPCQKRVARLHLPNELAQSNAPFA